MKESVLAIYKGIALHYLERQDTYVLYDASLFSQQLIETGIGPDELIEYHCNLIDSILTRCDSTEHKQIISKLSNVLVESSKVYKQSYREFKTVLNDLQKRYSELDRAKSELENLKDILRERTALVLQAEKTTALGEFTAEVADELNQPLNSVLAMSEELSNRIHKEGVDTKQLKKCLHGITLEIKTMAKVIARMKVFTGKTMNEHRETIPASAPIESAIQMMRHQLDRHAIEVRMELEEGLNVLANPAQLEQVFMNLIGNAVDATKDNTKETGRKVDIRLYLDAFGKEKNPFVVYEISDNGVGIAEGLKEKIFEPFFSGKSSAYANGLGLSVARQIIEEHGGQIHVGSREGEGAAFIIRMPAVTVVKT